MYIINQKSSDGYLFLAFVLAKALTFVFFAGTLCVGLPSKTLIKRYFLVINESFVLNSDSINVEY